MATNKDLHTLQVLNDAFLAAAKATDAYLRLHPNDWYPCGFAWVGLPGRSPLVKALKANFDEQRRGSKGYPKGWHIWNPSGNNTQCMDAKVAGAEAFVAVIKAAGFEAFSDCRMD